MLKKKKKTNIKNNKTTPTNPKRPQKGPKNQPQKGQPGPNALPHHRRWQQDAAAPNIRSCLGCSPKEESFFQSLPAFPMPRHAWRSWQGWAGKDTLWDCFPSSPLPPFQVGSMAPKSRGLRTAYAQFLYKSLLLFVMPVGATHDS